MASRRHWKFVVRDKYGFVIQNARVYVYQPGTSTSFTGAAYTAASGGSSVTNPITTNSQGEAEAFFDTPQSVDVFVDDNSNTAYRATGGVSALADFTSFTEQDEIGALVAADVTPTGQKTTASAGTGAEPARSDHVHPFRSNTGLTSKTTKTTTTEAVIGNALTTPANTVAAGSMFRITLKGYETNGTTGINWTFRVRWGGVAGTQLYSIVFASTTTAHTDNPVNLEFLVTIQTIGGTGTAVVSCSGDECFTTGTANTPKLVVGAQAAAVTIDTTASKDLVLTLELSATTGSPQFEVDNLAIAQVA